MNKLALNNLSRKIRSNDILLIKTPDYPELTSDLIAGDIASQCNCLVVLVYTPISDYSVQYIKLGSTVSIQYKSSL